MRKTRQQRAILILALMGVLHLQGRSKPEKKRVLNFIRIKGLYRPSERENREISTSEKAWENRFAWLRSDLHEEGIIDFRERDCWEITDLGREKFRDWLSRVRDVTLKNPEWREEIASISDPSNDFYLTPEAVELALKIGDEMNL